MVEILDDVKAELIRQGWHMEAQPFGSAVWMAWQKLKNVPDCADNEKPPCVTVLPIARHAMVTIHGIPLK